ncbi:hypothetical protein H0H93_002014, partial [Arthromyces matolae]
MASQVCSKTWCHQELPENYRFRTCPHCRERDCETKRAQRRRQSEKKGQAQGPDKENKRPRDGSENDAPPSTRTRKENSDGIAIIEDSDDSDSEKEDSNTFENAEDLFQTLRTDFRKNSIVNFNGTYTIAFDPMISFRDGVQMVQQEIWKVTGYRFTVKDHKRLKNGHKTRYWCSQDLDRKKKSKKSEEPGVKQRDNVGMKRYPCHSRLVITSRETEASMVRVTVRLVHGARHVTYTDVAMPEGALAIVRENVEWLTPVAMVNKVQATFPEVTAAQIHTAWSQMSQLYWRRDDEQLPSAARLLTEFPADVDVFTPVSVPDGVEIICWGMKMIAQPLKGKIFEVGMDATYNTNSKHLELYSVMAEHDNAGFPLSYCLLSTASAIDQGKRTKALTAWLRCLKDAYDINPQVVHVDKDMAEISSVRHLWSSAKISLCWWHLRRAVRTRLGNGKLATSPYNAKRANAEYSFIDVNFGPTGRTDDGDNEGGWPDDEPPPQDPASAAISSTPAAITHDQPTLTDTPTTSDIVELPNIKIPPRRVKFIDLSNMTSKIRLVAPRAPPLDPSQTNDEDGEDGRRTFCPQPYRDHIIKLMEKHYCAHPLIPGYAMPHPDGIKKWAVRNMYSFCVEHDLPHLWAYLWQNWYRKGRWELWARSASKIIPVLKTTMILESHWRRIKHDFLHHFHMPRCDLLAWILVVKLAPTYYRKLNRLLSETGRYRELSSWRKGFKREWKKLAKTPISLPLNDAYRPDAHKMVCTCPYLATSRFLLCKHVVQAVHPVPPVFFLEVKRQRTAPIWVHPTLKPLDSDADPPTPDLHAEDDELDRCDDEDDEDDEGLIDVEEDETNQTFEESLDELINTVEEWFDGLRYQKQFRDKRLLQTIFKEGGGAAMLRMARS